LTRRLSGSQLHMHNTKHVSATHRLVQRPSSSDPRLSSDLLYTTHCQSGGQSMGLQEEKPLSGFLLHVEYLLSLFRTDRKITFSIFTILSHNRGVTGLCFVSSVSSATFAVWQEVNFMYLQYPQRQLWADRMITICIFSIINHTRRLTGLWCSLHLVQSHSLGNSIIILYIFTIFKHSRRLWGW
jgi:hypothetical protein